MRHAIIAAFAVLLLASPARGQEAAPTQVLKELLAASAYLRGDYARALRLWRPLAEQGHAAAQANLGSMYRNGEGVPQDDAEAVNWYRKAAEQGFAQAQNNLGFMYDNGTGVPLDDAEAVNWYRRAAEQGLASAQNNLGLSYANGEGVGQDYVQAHMWLNLAGAQGDKRAAKFRDIAAKRMTPAQIAEAQKLALEWKPK